MSGPQGADPSPRTQSWGGPQGPHGSATGPLYPGPPYGSPSSGFPYGGWAYTGGPWSPQQAGPGTRQDRRAWTAGAVALALVLSAALGFGVASRVRSGNAVAPGAVPAAPDPGGSIFGGGSGNPPATVPDGSSVSARAAAVAAGVDPGVVDINTVLGFQGGTAAGTGMVLTASGEVLTNNHVVAGATAIRATLVTTGKTYTATVVGTDESEDVAVIQLQGASGLKVVTTGDSSALRVGQPLVAIGNALGAGGTPSVVEGTVQALNQTITAGDAAGGTAEQLSGLIQTNAPLQPGDSGGPLSSLDGKVVGMDTAASTTFRFRAATGASFAIPIKAALSIANQIESGRASANIHIGESGFLGVSVDTSAAAPAGGATILGVEQGTPAQAAGLTGGDVITSVDGRAIGSGAALTSALGAHHPGDKVAIEWTDGSGRTHRATIGLTSGPVK